MTKYAFVSAERGNHAVATLCRIVGVSISGFLCHISWIFETRRRVYGSPRIHAETAPEGKRPGRQRIERLMREMGLSVRQGRRRTPRTTDSGHDLPIAPNRLERNFATERATRCGWPTSLIFRL